MKPQQNNPGRYDVIIIGAGIGGLTSGALLAKAGLKTLVLEQHSLPGGYCTTFKRKGFSFNAAVHNIGGCGQNGLIHYILKELGVLEEISFTRLDPFHTYVLPDEIIRIPDDYERARNYLCERFPEEKRAIDKLFDQMRRMYFESLRLPNNIGLFGYITFPLRFPTLFKWHKKTFKEFFEAFSQNKKLLNILACASGYSGLHEDMLSGVYWSIALMSYFLEGSWYPMGGFQALADVFAKALKQNNGELRLRTHVRQITVENNQVTGVILDNAEQIEARVVISNSDAIQTFTKLIDERILPPKYLKQLKESHISISAFLMYLGIKGKLNLPNHRDHEIFYMRDSEKFLCDLANLEEMNSLRFHVCLSSIVDPESAPPDHHSLKVMSIARYDWCAWSKEDKEKIADRMLMQLEKIIPGITEAIVYKETATPKTCERYTLNTDGAIFGWAHTPHQVGPSRLGVSTPIHNLYLAGHWTQPGGGIWPVVYAGMNASNQVKKDLKVKDAKILVHRPPKNID